MTGPRPDPAEEACVHGQCNECKFPIGLKQWRGRALLLILRWLFIRGQPLVDELTTKDVIAYKEHPEVGSNPPKSTSLVSCNANSKSQLTSVPSGRRKHGDKYKSS